MKYEKLGNSDLTVSKVCLGCMGFGKAQSGMHSWTIDEKQSKEIIKYALDHGINFFDTAMVYQGGTSEEFLGNAIKEYVKREDVVIATKFPAISKELYDTGISAKEYINQCLEGSLKRLQTNYVDLYILHSWDKYFYFLDILVALNELIESGKVKAIGISNCFAYQLAKANEITKSHHLKGFVSVQGHYNLIFREEEREMALYCKEDNIAMTPYSALASGRLAKHPGETSKRMEEDAYAKGKYDATYEDDLVIIKRVEELASKHNVSMSEVSLSWLMNKVTSPVVGATKISHVETAVSAVELTLSDEEKAYLEEPYKPHKLVGMMAQ